MGLVNVRLFANLREIVGRPTVTVEAATVREVLEILNSEHPALRALICEERDVRPYITILINGKNIHEMEELLTNLSDGDEVAIFPPVSGG